IMNAQAQHAIKGRVVDESGKGFPGASIQVKGTSIGTKTNEDGYYSLNVPDINAVLVFSYIGYVSKEVKAAGQSSLNVDLSPNAEALSEVVVVGYGTQRKESVTGSVASISGSDLNQVPTPNISQALQGRLPGV